MGFKDFKINLLRKWLKINVTVDYSSVSKSRYQTGCGAQSSALWIHIDLQGYN